MLYSNGWWVGANRPPPVDAFQQHRQLRAAQRHCTFFRLRPDETATFQPLGEQTESVAIPPKELDQIATPAAEDENMARVRILLQRRLRDGTQPGEAASQIGNAGGNPDIRAGGQRNHRPTRSRTRRRLSASTGPSMRIRARPTSTTITPAYNFAGCASLLTISATRTGNSGVA